jgi:hypothetical protein
MQVTMGSIASDPQLAGDARDRRSTSRRPYSAGALLSGWGLLAVAVMARTALWLLRRHTAARRSPAPQ